MTDEIKTARLLLRRAKDRDFKDIFPIRQSEYVLKYNCMPKLDEEGTIRMIKNDAQNSFTWYMELSENRKAIGAVYFHEDSLRYNTNTMEVSYWMREEYSSKGLMAEALSALIDIVFTEFKLAGVTARCFEENVASQKLLIKLGFTKEGVLKNAVKAYKGITYSDTLFYIENPKKI